MKTVKKVKEEIASTNLEIKANESGAYDKKKRAAAKRLRAKLVLLKQYVLYLETDPTKEYCQKESDRITNRINEIEKSYIPPQEPERFSKGALSKMKKSFEKEWDMPKLRKQLSTMLYLLKS